MIDLKQLHQELVKEIPDYQFEYKNKGFRERIIAKKDTFRGAEIYELDNQLYVIPIVPTFKGRLLFGIGIGLAPAFIKRFEEVAITVEAHLAARSKVYETALIQNPKDIPLSKRQLQIDAYLLPIIGFGALVVAFYYLLDIWQMAQEKGEVSLSSLWNTDSEKPLIVIIFSILGVAMLFEGIKKVRLYGER